MRFYLFLSVSIHINISIHAHPKEYCRFQCAGGSTAAILDQPDLSLVTHAQAAVMGRV